jgi:hypothetical protein
MTVKANFKYWRTPRGVLDCRVCACQNPKPSNNIVNAIVDVVINVVVIDVVDVAGKKLKKYRIFRSKFSPFQTILIAKTNKVFCGNIP